MENNMTAQVINLADYRKSKVQSPTKQDTILESDIAPVPANILDRVSEVQAQLIRDLEILDKAAKCLAFAHAELERIETEAEMVENAILSGNLEEMERAREVILSNRKG
jgi:hypothetical protein